MRLTEGMANSSQLRGIISTMYTREITRLRASTRPHPARSRAMRANSSRHHSRKFRVLPCHRPVRTHTASRFR